MKTNKYMVAVGLLVVLAVAFGIIGTVAPPLAEESTPVQPQQESSPESVGHFQNPPTYDSGWVNITDKCGQYFNITHDLDTTEVFIDITGKQSLGGGEHQRNLGGTSLIPGWSRTYGGTEDETALCIVRTCDGGYALAGHPSSDGAGNLDFLLVKTDLTGNVLWNRTYGGSDRDVPWSMIQTSDGGYALAGEAYSFGAGSADVWLVKTDSNGNMLWNKTYGGTDFDCAYSLVQTSDGGYALAGCTDYDFWLVKTDSAGNMAWNKTYGGENDEDSMSIVQTSDEGYALAGYTMSFGAGDWDFWLVKTDSTGNTVWDRTYGGTGSDGASAVVQTSDGGYALTGWTASFGAGTQDVWLVKTDSNGNMLWNRTYGGAGDDYASSMVYAGDRGYALAGCTYSFGAGDSDFWLVKTDTVGNVQWNKTYGGAKEEYHYHCAVTPTNDGGYALASGTRSFGAGGCDLWLIKTDVESGLAWMGTTSNNITLYRGATDIDWNYVRVRLWTIKEPTWQYGDINMDGVVDAKDLYIIGRNYGKTCSLLSVTGIIAVAGIRTVKKRRQSEQPSSIS